MDDRRRLAKARRPCLDGSIGRLTYFPARPGEETIGQLRRNRAKDEAPRFKQVTPFTSWCAPARDTGLQPRDVRLSQRARSQENWLLEHLPEAAVDDVGFESLLMQEIAAAEPKRPNKRPTFTTPGPLISTGEIVDQRGADGVVKGHPALAVASGVAGNVLRLIGLSLEEWGWSEADIKVRVHAVDSQLEGEWCQNDLPISLLKFAVDSKNSDPIRWLLVQNGTSTVVYAPEVRAIPMPVAGATALASRNAAAGQIFANPLFTISRERTGGSLQTDVCFGRCPETNAPQLVVVDQGGCWSLWGVKARRDGRFGKLQPVMKMCGSTVSGSIPKLPSSSSTSALSYTVLILSLRQGRSYSSSRTGSPSEEPRGSEKDRSRQSQRLLLLSNPKAIHLFDLSRGSMHPVSHLGLNETHRILAVAPSRLDLSQAFILTSTSLLWVAVRKDTATNVTLEILVSCPHQRDIDDPTLQLDVSPGAYIKGLAACFVCVRSSRNTEVTTFWFINPTSDAPVRYYRDLVSLPSASNFIGLSILPVNRLVGKNEPVSGAGRAMRKGQLRFFQLLTLGPDLDVHGALCAWSDVADVVVGPPDFKENLEDEGNRRTKLLRKLTSAFVVPDEFDERAVFRKAGTKAFSQELRAGRIGSRADYTLVAQRLSAIGDSPAGILKGEGDQDFSFVDDAIEHGKQDGYMPRQSLLDLAISRGAGDNLITLARQWDARQEALHRRAGGWVFVPEARRPVIDFGPDDLVERLREIFPDPQQSGENASSEDRDAVLEKMAAEMYLSSIGISSVPEAWTAATADGPPPSFLPFPSSPTLMSSSQPWPGSPSKITSHSPKTEKEGEAAGMFDPVALRLRKYAPINTSAKFSTGEPPVLALSRWELGEDPEDTAWNPGLDVEAEQAISWRRRKIEARRRKAERLSQMILGESAGGFGGSLGGGGLPDPLSSSQPPTILSTSQPQLQSQSQQPWELGSARVLASPTRRVFAGSPLRREVRRESSGRRESGFGGFGQSRSQAGVGMSSQSQGLSQGTPSQARSQVVPGVFGGRVSLSPFKKSPVKRVKRKSELRLSGFR
ncbi:hypothetical protein VTK26DRAFT_3050 [Humicola hyalothermophila]